MFTLVVLYLIAMKIFREKALSRKFFFAENSVYSLYNDTLKHFLAEDCVYSLYNDTSTEHFKELKPKLHLLRSTQRAAYARRENKITTSILVSISVSSF